MAAAVKDRNGGRHYFGPAWLFQYQGRYRRDHCAGSELDRGDPDRIAQYGEVIAAQDVTAEQNSADADQRISPTKVQALGHAQQVHPDNPHQHCEPDDP